VFHEPDTKFTELQVLIREKRGSKSKRESEWQCESERYKERKVVLLKVNHENKKQKQRTESNREQESTGGLPDIHFQDSASGHVL